MSELVEGRSSIKRYQTDQQPGVQPRTLWDKTWKDGQGKRVIYQWPNAWIIVWAICGIVAIFVASKSVAGVLGHIGSAALIVWALLEIFKGVNYFRRGLGVIVLLLALASQLRAIL